VLSLLVLVTSEELKYMMVQSWDVGLGKRSMPQAITCTNYTRGLGAIYYYLLGLPRITRAYRQNAPLSRNYLPASSSPFFPHHYHGRGQKKA
jgi:hypothetical protein